MDKFPVSDCFDEQLEAMGIKNPTELNCMVCNKEFIGEEPVVCCNGRECGCMGLPEPIVCSQTCYHKLPLNKEKNILEAI